MIIGCYFTRTSEQSEQKELAPLLPSALITTAIELTLLICGLLAIAKVGAFQNMSTTNRIIFFSMGCGLTLADILGTMAVHKFVKSEDTKNLLSRLKSLGMSISVTDNGYRLNLGNQRDFIPPNPYIVQFGRARQYPILHQSRAHPDLLDQNEYLFYILKDDGDLSDVRVMLKLKHKETTKIHHVNLVKFLRVDQSKVNHKEVPKSKLLDDLPHAG